jgi:hypothetical protein
MKREKRKINGMEVCVTVVERGKFRIEYNFSLGFLTVYTKTAEGVWVQSEHYSRYENAKQYRRACDAARLWRDGKVKDLGSSLFGV